MNLRNAEEMITNLATKLTTGDVVALAHKLTALGRERQTKDLVAGLTAGRQVRTLRSGFGVGIGQQITATGRTEYFPRGKGSGKYYVFTRPTRTGPQEMLCAECELADSITLDLEN